MHLPPFLLDHWLASYEFATPPIRHDLAASTGPRWSVDELLAIAGGASIGDIKIGYAPPDGTRALREAIGAFHGVDPDWVVAATGASEAMSVLFCLAAEPGRNVVLPDPAFSAFSAMAGAWGLGARTYALDRTAGYRLDAGTVVAAADAGTVLTLVNTPHNPTGAVVVRDEIEMLAGALAERGIPLVVDEVYHPLYIGAPQRSAAAVDNVITMSDMSKALSLPGLRLGWIIDADPRRRKRIIDARSYFTISGSPVLEAMAVHALRNSDVILRRLEEVATQNLGRLTATMERVSDVLDWTRPEGGTVSFPWFRDGRDARPFCTRLAAAGVLVAPGDCFGKPDHMRIGFAKSADGYAEALDIFERVLREA